MVQKRECQSEKNRKREKLIGVGLPYNSDITFEIEKRNREGENVLSQIGA